MPRAFLVGIRTFVPAALAACLALTAPETSQAQTTSATQAPDECSGIFASIMPPESLTCRVNAKPLQLQASLPMGPSVVSSQWARRPIPRCETPAGPQETGGKGQCQTKATRRAKHSEAGVKSNRSQLISENRNGHGTRTGSPAPEPSDKARKNRSELLSENRNGHGTPGGIPAP